MSHNQNYQ
jgi:tellurite resistance-related uncharacterized protein